MAALYALYALLALCPLALTRHDDDFAFDNSEELQVELTANHSEIEKNGLKRLWGVPDTSAYVGHLFRMEIPKEAFSGEVLAYKVRAEGGRHTPSWLAVDSRHGIISGVPLAHDRGSHTFTVTAHGRTAGLTAADTFTVEVKKSEEKPQSKYGSCAGGLNRLVLTILVETSFAHITPRQRIRALMELANFMALDGDEFWIEPYKVESNHENTVLMSGVGTAQRKRNEGTTAIYLNVGCGDKLWSRHKVLVMGLREQVRDGTLAQVLRLPVLGWRLSSVKPAPRLKRQITDDVGSGGYYEGDDDDDADYSGYDDEDDYGPGEFEPVTSPKVDPPPPSASPSIPFPDPEVPHPHPHRHHHGELLPELPEYPNAPRTTAADTTFQTETEVNEVITVSSDTTFSAAHTTASTTPSVVAIDLPSPSPSPTPRTTDEEPSTGAPASADITLELATTTNTIVSKERNNVKIEPYSGNSSDSSNVIHATIDRKEHSPVIIVPENDITTSTEPELVKAFLFHLKICNFY
ncbi:Dystroglycan [Eumeta japonica]|uniref:Dystroglycan n=1 Tax=Eumeta variegata TaxID=151549 RepID=A0A4C1XHM0_EUMVA|nr:Dystroglycan [Eumeta japonica]